MPLVRGTPHASAVTIRLYRSADCTGPVAVEGSAATFASPGLSLSVTLNVTTTISAAGVDGAGTPSACSAPISYTHDTVAPSAPTGSDRRAERPGLGLGQRHRGGGFDRARLRRRGVSRPAVGDGRSGAVRLARDHRAVQRSPLRDPGAGRRCSRQRVAVLVPAGLRRQRDRAERERLRRRGRLLRRPVPRDDRRLARPERAPGVRAPVRERGDRAQRPGGRRARAGRRRPERQRAVAERMDLVQPPRSTHRSETTTSTRASSHSRARRTRTATASASRSTARRRTRTAMSTARGPTRG